MIKSVTVSFLQKVQYLFLQRFFSISSSPDVYANEIHVTAVVVEYYKRGKWQKATAQGIKFIYLKTKFESNFYFFLT